jgi:hypothetical protein
MRRRSSLAPAFHAIEDTLKSHELSSALRPYFAKVHWDDVVGPQVAAVTQIESIRSGNDDGRHVLVVRVKNGVWANELTLLKGDLLRRLNRALGGQVLSDIHFKASGLSRARVSPPLPAPPVPDLESIALSGEVLAQIEESVATVQDEELQSRIRRSLIHAAKADQWKRAQGWAPCARCGTLTPSSDRGLCPLCRVQSQTKLN